MTNDYHDLHIVYSYLVLNSFYDIQISKLYSRRTFEVAYLSSEDISQSQNTGSNYDWNTS